MVFSSFTFLFFFLPVLLVAYYLIPSRLRQGRNSVLLIFSLIFYAFGGVALLSVMCLSICINYVGGILAAPEKGKRKTVLFLTVAANLLLLGWFKYAGFLAETVNALGTALPVPQVTLPIGISFYTFQGISYVVDVYRGDVARQKNPLKLALYLALFPQLIAGPIVRYRDVAAEIDGRTESIEDFSDGMVRFSFGLAKKMLLANTFGEIAGAVFSGPLSLSTPSAWVGALAYTLQIYFDFSGYSDMAIGLGRTFGFHFMENFNYPYISRSVKEFWTRWHISLSSWFRDYIYIPLGGSRTARWKYVRNLLLVWMLTGLWHGAAWNFILWGGWYGLLLLGERFLWGRYQEKAPAFLRWAVTMFMVILGWMLFRAGTLGEAVSTVGVLLGVGAAPEQGQAVYLLLEYWPEWLCGLAACLPIKNWLREHIGTVLQSWAPKVAALGLVALSYMTLVTSSFNPFLYYRF